MNTDNDWARSILEQERARIVQQSTKLDVSPKGLRAVPGGFECSMRMGRVER